MALSPEEDAVDGQEQAPYLAEEETLSLADASRTAPSSCSSSGLSPHSLADKSLLSIGPPKSGEILMFVCSHMAKSPEILMFVCLQRDTKQ